VLAGDPVAPTAAWAMAGDPSTPATTTAMMTPGTVSALRARVAARRKSLAIMGLLKPGGQRLGTGMVLFAG
jgi:hypothetical protein